MAYPTPDLLQYYKSVREFHKWAYTGSQRILGGLKNAPTIGNCADVSLVLKRCASLEDDVRKETNRVTEHAMLIATGLWMQQGTGAKIKGELCSAYVDPRVTFKMPRRSQDPSGYAAACEFFGVPENLVDSGLLDFRYDGVRDFVTKHVASGFGMPKALEGYGLINQFGLSCRERKDVVLDKKADSLLKKEKEDVEEVARERWFARAHGDYY